MNTAVPAPDSPRLPEGNVAGHLERLARSKGWWDRTAYLVGSDTFTFADVHEGAARAAGVLAARGVGLGSRVLLALPVGTSFVWGVWGYLGALRLGAVVLPLTPGTSAENLTAAVASAPPQLAVCDEPLGLPGVPELAGSQLTDRRAPLVPWQRLPAPTRAFECCDFSWRDTPCLYAHRHCDALVFDQAAHTAMGLDPADVCLSRSPLTTAFGLGNAILLPLLRGSTTVLCDTTAQAGESLAHIRRHGVTVFVTPPPRKRGGFSLDRMGSHDGQALTAAEAGSQRTTPLCGSESQDAFPARPEGRDSHARSGMGPPSAYGELVDIRTAGSRDVLAALRLAVIGEGVLPYGLARRLRQRFGARLLHLLATPETGHAVWAHSPDSSATCSHGRVLAPYRMRVVDRSGRDTPVGTQGQLQVSGVTVGPGTAQHRGPGVFVQGQWTPTAYTATKDEDGSVWIHDRPHITADRPVLLPEKLERVLMEHPAVRGASVHLVHEDGPKPGLRAHLALHDDPADASRLELVRLCLLTRIRRTLGPAYLPEELVFVRGGLPPRTEPARRGPARRALSLVPGGAA